MRSRFVVCAALAGIGLLGVWSPARAADPKAKPAKKKSGDGLSDDKVISKQLQWEDSVMGPDDKRGELDKIARAQAINKAASEKAERERTAREVEAASLLSKTVLTIHQRAGEDGKLFGSVTATEIAEAIKAARGMSVEKKKIDLHEPIRETGTYLIDVEIAGGVKASVKTIVAPESD